MPLHLHHFPILQTTHFLHLPPSIRVHSFSASAIYLAGSHNPTYYEILDVPVTATTAEIKKKFYSLSLRHHPDRNQKDPKASGKFASISSAYQTLGNASKRARYDRDNNIHRPPEHHTHAHGHGHHGRHSHAHHQGSFSSSSTSSYVGSRPASGLSKRRGQFRGPPPSFYAHGGHGTSGRSTAGAGASTDTSGPGPGPGPSSSSSAYNPSGKSTTSSSSTREDPTSFINHNPVPHFNARSHFRTQSHEDARRISRRNRAIEEERERRRARGEDVEGDVEGSHLVRLLVVGGMLTFAGAIATVMRSISEAGAGPGHGTGHGTGHGEKRKKVG